MPRKTIYLPQRVLDALDQLPNLNLSKVVQKAIEGALHCWHDQLACAHCGAEVDHQHLVSTEVSRFYSDAQFALGQLVHTGRGTAEGACRVLKDVAGAWHAKGLLHRDAFLDPLPRSTRSVREALTLRDHDTPRTGRQRAAAAIDTDRRAQLLRDEESA